MALRDCVHALVAKTAPYDSGARVDHACAHENDRNPVRLLNIYIYIYIYIYDIYDIHVYIHTKDFVPA
jgi:hypothetical protein